MESPRLHPSDPWPQFRQQMPVTGHWAYFDHAAVSPLPQPTRQALLDWTADNALHGVQAWPRWKPRLTQVRRLAAEMIGATTAEVALVANTTTGVSLVAEGFPWQAGDNVVTIGGDFPSNRFAWENLARRGVQVRTVPTVFGRLDLADVARACDRRTRIVAASWVAFDTGWRNDPAALAETAHRAGALLFLDAIQGLGMFPLDVRAAGVDFLAADGHKWLLGPEGAGVLYVAQEHLELLAPLGLGWNSARNVGDYSHVVFDLKPTAERYEGGSYNVVGFVGLAASLELLAGFGAERIGPRVLEIGDAACDMLRSVGADVVSMRQGERRSGIVAFDLPGQDPWAVRRRALEAGVSLSVRVGRLRISPHAYNDASDLERLREVLKS